MRRPYLPVLTPWSLTLDPGMQLMEWYYTQAEEKMGDAALPPPPPPPALRPHPQGVPLPEDTAICPICSQVNIEMDLMYRNLTWPSLEWARVYGKVYAQMSGF